MKNVKILLMEDSQKEAARIISWLTKAGFAAADIRHAVSVQAALSLLEQERFDVIMPDLSSSDQSGVETFRMLSQMAAETPIIILSGEENNALIDALLTDGAQDVLVKRELNAQVLLHAIRFAVERQALTVKLKKKTQEVELLKESIEGIVQQNLDAVLVVDDQKVICYANAAAVGIFGRSSEELHGSAFPYGVNAGQTLETEIQISSSTKRTIEMRGIEILWGKRRAMLITVKDQTWKCENDGNYTDALTGVFNKAYLDEQAKHLDCPKNMPLCVIVGDVNNLQLINDSLGCEAGDQLLQAVACCFQSACIQESIVIRYGGDEFMIIQCRCNEQDAERIMEKIKRSCKECSMEGFPISIALGSAVKYSGDTLSLFDLLWIADEHMYAKKYTVISPSKYSAVISSLEKSLYAKDYATAMHTSRVRDLCVSFGKYMHLDSSVIDELIILSALHDIGKIALPSSLLCKSGQLTDNEWETVKTHPLIGAKIAKITHGMDTIAQNILSHHERWDGMGYPNGQKGEEIPLPARILSIVDSFDVMTHDRPYKRAIGEQDALKEIERYNGTQFDPKLAQAFVAFICARETHY